MAMQPDADPVELRALFKSTGCDVQATQALLGAPRVQASPCDQQFNGALTHEQLVAFYENGFLHFRGVVEEELVREAKRAINVSLGQGINSATHHLDDLLGAKRRVFCPELKKDPRILALLTRSAALRIADCLLGRTLPTHGAQIALVFPKAEEHDPRLWFNQAVLTDKRAWHIDGVTTSFAKVDKIHNFSLLCGVYLSEAREDLMGNFTVFPGAHHLMQDAIREHGCDSLVNEGVPMLPLPPPHQLRVSPGDVVVAQYHLPHSVAPNISPDVRYAVYFRLFGRSRGQVWKFSEEAMYNMWMEFEGVWPVVKEREGVQPYMV